MGAMKLIEDFSTHVSVDWSPRKTVKKTGREQMVCSKCFLAVRGGRLIPQTTNNFLGLEEMGICNFFPLSFILPLCSLPNLDN